jgi:GNAT superfamily N-acetyltransferase
MAKKTTDARLPSYTLEKYSLKHASMDFDCENDEINDFFWDKCAEYVQQDLCRVHVFVQNEAIIGFFAISSKTVRLSLDNQPEMQIPVFLIGQLGVDTKFKHQGWGSFILERAFELGLNLRESIGSKGIFIETYDKGLVEDFYTQAGYTLLRTDKLDENKLRYGLFKPFPPREM